MISAIVLTKNSQDTLKECLSSLTFCNEIIVIDDSSTDSTQKVAKEMGAVVYEKKLNGNFADSRNFALTKAKNEWVLYVDSDEQVSVLLADEIKRSIKKTNYRGYTMPRQDRFEGKVLEHGETGTIKVLRLGQKKAGTWKRKVHETWQIEGPIGQLRYPILHYPHPTIAEFLADIDTYSTVHAEELKREGKKANPFTIIAYPTGKFMKNYLLKLGFLDGVQGCVMAIMMSFHSFLSQAKLWQMQQTPKK